MPPSAVCNRKHVCFKSFFNAHEELWCSPNSTTLGTSMLISYEESGEHFSFSFPAASLVFHTAKLRVLWATFCILLCKEANRHVWFTLQGASHSELSDSLRQWKSVEKVAPSRKNQTWLICLFSWSQKPFFPSLSFSNRTCKYHWFLIFLFLLFITELFISYFPHHADEAVLVCAFFVNKFLFSQFKL